MSCGCDAESAAVQWSGRFASVDEAALHLFPMRAYCEVGWCSCGRVHRAMELRVRWLGVVWRGVPFPKRLWIVVRNVWLRERAGLEPIDPLLALSAFSQCGCVDRIKGWWEAVLARGEVGERVGDQIGAQDRARGSERGHSIGRTESGLRCGYALRVSGD